MISKEDNIVMRAIAICFKEYLKPEEALILTDLKRTQFAVKCEEYGIYKNQNGYYSRSDLNQILSGSPARSIQDAVRKLRVGR